MCSKKEEAVYHTHLFVAAGVMLTLLAFWDYNARDGKINTASWLLWVIGDVLEAGSYFIMTGQDLLKNAIPIAFAFGSCITFVVALGRRRFGIPDVQDRVIMGVDIAITAGWWQHYLSAVGANIMFVATEVISFIPLYRGILTGREREYALPFVFWALADGLFLAAVFSLSHTWEEMVYPTVALFAHLLVVVCIAVRNKNERVPG